MIVFQHIPKTAGTTFLQILDVLFGHVCRDYFGTQEKVDGHKCVAGHFTAEEIIEKYGIEGNHLITWIREPVSRTISHYNYLKYSAKAETAVVKQVRSGMSIVEFAALPRFRNFLTRHLRCVTFEDFVFVGLVEQFEKSLKLFQYRTGNPTLPHFENKRVQKRKDFLSVEDKKIITDLNIQDIQLYDEWVGWIEQTLKEIP